MCVRVCDDFRLHTSYPYRFYEWYFFCWSSVATTRPFFVIDSLVIVVVVIISDRSFPSPILPASMINYFMGTLNNNKNHKNPYRISRKQFEREMKTIRWCRQVWTDDATDLNTETNRIRCPARHKRGEKLVRGCSFVSTRPFKTLYAENVRFGALRSARALFIGITADDFDYIFMYRLNS